MFEGNLLIKIGPEKRKNARSWSQKKEGTFRSKNQKSKAARNMNRKKRKTVRIKILILK
ncbi:MAG TPA: hypothetical protein VN414_10070 [Methanosarcina sp.]|nr:hypothetical protein [Methanosarcina sp.]